LGAIAPELRRAVAAIPHWRKWPLFDTRAQLAQPWAHGPMLSLGDAAHPMLPYLAQGAVMALEDAVTLGQLYGPDAHAPDVFARFEALRRPRVLRVARTAERNGLIYHQSWSMARNMVLRTLPPQRQLALFDWLYGYDATALGDGIVRQIVSDDGRRSGV
jgi:salicylate hydroxylase